MSTHRSSADYIDRTIATVRNHRDADNCWPQWANIFADEIEDLRADVEALLEAAKEIPPEEWPHGSSAQVIVPNRKLIALAAAVRHVEGRS